MPWTFFLWLHLILISHFASLAFTWYKHFIHKHEKEGWLQRVLREEQLKTCLLDTSFLFISLSFILYHPRIITLHPVKIHPLSIFSQSVEWNYFILVISFDLIDARVFPGYKKEQAEFGTPSILIPFFQNILRLNPLPFFSCINAMSNDLWIQVATWWSRMIWKGKTRPEMIEHSSISMTGLIGVKFLHFHATYYEMKLMIMITWGCQYILSSYLR